ncbi:Ig domain-containing protein [Streptomyces sp. CBMA29]|uniref:Ig domain-containing protein n=1 Tax=Streptomyces sp. CBMA29 TaxID=1896314 RepID=UPI001661D2D0|nr:Ig domain-containing protein [Streptomyces sp. CBMA29]MBD0737843.1 hypothetical protein [Streptomyces sp. CBMA29]
MQRRARGRRRGPLNLIIATAAVLAAGVAALLTVNTAHAAGVTGPLKSSGKCLDDTGGVTTSGNPIEVYDCNGSGAQNWNLPGDGTVRVFGKCLDIKNGATSPGTRVQLWDCNGSDAQKWQPGATSSLVNPGTGLCLDIVNGSAVNGNPVQIWACNGSAAQQWTLPTGDGGGTTGGTTGGGTGGTLGVTGISTQSTTLGVATGLLPASTGGTGQVQWSATGLPAGLSMNYINGTIMGTPTATGSSTVTVKATDANGATGTGSFTWTVTAPAAVGSSYYLDCSAASNGSGTQSSPWNTLGSANSHTFGPGDKLLLKKGTTCHGKLTPKGSGSATAPITLDGYGSGAAPVVAGDGLTNPDPSNLISEATVALTNQSYWIIQNLEVTNNASAEALRSGIEVFGTDGQEHDGITIRDNNVHDVMGWTSRSANLDWYYLSHGIGVEIPTQGTFFKGVTVSGNSVHDIHGVGVGLYGDQHNWNDNPVRNRYVLVTGNTVRNISHDGIVVSVSDSPLTERNVADRLGVNGRDGVYAGIWGWGDTNPTFQYNEVSHITRVTDDSVAWDCDGSMLGTCTYQYNYDHDNSNGILLVCASCGRTTTLKVVYRYNVSVNDCRFHKYTDGALSVDFYNNTIDCRNKAFDFGETPSITKFSNNVFIGQAGSSLPSGPTYKANTYVGFTPPSDPQASTADPRLVSANGVGTPGIGSIGGYKLLSGSPALRSGTTVPGNFGTDLWGNPVNTATPNRGAYAGQGE